MVWGRHQGRLVVWDIARGLWKHCDDRQFCCHTHHQQQNPSTEQRHTGAGGEYSEGLKKRPGKSGSFRSPYFINKRLYPELKSVSNRTIYTPVLRLNLKSKFLELSSFLKWPISFPIEQVIAYANRKDWQAKIKNISCWWKALGIFQYFLKKLYD